MHMCNLKKSSLCVSVCVCECVYMLVPPSRRMAQPHII